MTVYNAPLRDMRFVYYELNNGKAIQELPGYADADEETVLAVLEEADKIAREVLLPINRQGDEQGCVFENGKVTTPAGFKAAYATYIESGWNSIAMDAEYGGQGLPKSLHILVDEMVCAANLSFSLYPGLTNGAWNALASYASDELKDIYFPKMAEGTWSGSMCLTEPHSGTDLGLLRTKAELQDDGSYTISGSKIFITAGDHDLTENIVHLVLAKTPNAPAGIKGISLFLVPKFLPSADGGIGAANGVSVGSIEHKMGIKASATCVMNFDGAQGWLVGEENKGMRAMFEMMNIERLAVGVQGLGVAECAYQNAVAYAKERLQGVSPRGAGAEKTPQPLTVHPDVRRMLLTMRALTEGSRALVTRVALWLDISNKSQDAKTQQLHENLVALMTPVIKAYVTDMGYEVTNTGMQVFGGHGYIREHGMEQLARDARIAQIYEGTNGIQAMDLVGRKLPMGDGKMLSLYLDPVVAYIEQKTADSALTEFVQPLSAAVKLLQDATDFILSNAQQDKAEVGAAAVDYLNLFAYTALAYEWAQMAEIGLSQQTGDESLFYEAKVRTARFFMQRLLPRTEGLHRAITAGAASTMDFDDAAW